MSGRIRTLKPELLEDEKLANLDAGAKFLFVACILLSDDHGSFRAAPSFLAGQAFWGSRRDARNVPQWLSQLVELGLVRTYVVRGQRFGEIVNWKKHQKIDHAGARRLPTLEEADVAEVKPEPQANLAPGNSSETLARTSEIFAMDQDQDLDLDLDPERERERHTPARSRVARSTGRNPTRSATPVRAKVAKREAEPNPVPSQPNAEPDAPVEAGQVSSQPVAAERPASPRHETVAEGDGARADESRLSAEGKALFEAMQKHDELRGLSPRFADKLAGESMASGQSIGLMVEAIGEAASELAARQEGGAHVPAPERASLVRRYVAQARRRGDRADYAGRRASGFVAEKQRSGEQEPTAEQIRAMYPEVVVARNARKPGERIVPPAEVNDLLSSLMQHGGRGGISTTATAPMPRATSEVEV